jgi:glycosyltransferase involved in cell wall biosynthesis
MEAANPPLVSVITPTKNRLTLLGEALDSVAAQTLSDWEHIVIDDGSTDGTSEMMAARASADPRVRYFARQGERSGANVCRNLGVHLARADLVVFLDDDDHLRPHCLAQRTELMGRNPDWDFVVFPADLFERAPGDLQRPYQILEPGDHLLSFLGLECPWEISGPVWRRSFFERIGGFDEQLRSMQDVEMHVRALVARANYALDQRTDHDIRAQIDHLRTSTRHFQDPEYIRRSEDTPAMLRRHVLAAGLSSWSRQRALLGLGYGAAERWARVGRLGEALRCWREACRLNRGSAAVAAGGVITLCLTRLDPRHEGLAFRFVNKWKGWVRFRQEPDLIAP